jgi:hypothetical protein
MRQPCQTRPALDVSVPAPADLRWQRLTSTANRAFASDRVDAARRLYERALREAERLLAAANGGELNVPAAVILNISCHNLAVLLERIGDVRAAGALYCRAFTQLSVVALSTEVPAGVRSECAKHLMRAALAFANYLQTIDGQERRTSAVLDRSCLVLAAVLGDLETDGSTPPKPRMHGAAERMATLTGAITS